MRFGSPSLPQVEHGFETRQKDNRTRKQEGKPGRISTRKPQEQGCSDCNSGATHSGDQRDRLSTTNQQSVAPSHGVGIAVSWSVSIGEKKESAENRKRDYRNHWAAKHFLDRICEQPADHQSRNCTDDDCPGDPAPPAFLLPDDGSTCQRPKRVNGQLPEITSEVNQHCEKRSDMQRNIESETQVVPAEDPGDDQQVSRTADREEFGQSLDHSKYDGLPHRAVKHQTNVSCVGR